MINKNLIIVVIISLIFGLALGFFGGISRKPIVQKVPENTFGGTVANLLKSKLIQSWTAMASGEVSKISGRNLTLVSNGETLEIPITNEAKVVMPVILSPEEIKENKTPQPPKEITFEDIKIGDEINVSISIADNELKGNYIVVFPK